MMIKDLFVKPIDRDIKGVIKVGQDDSSNVRQELEEYAMPVLRMKLKSKICTRRLLPDTTRTSHS